MDLSTANHDFDFDSDDEGENPFVYDVEASSKGMAFPAPPLLSPVYTDNTRSIAGPLFSPGIRRGPLSYYGSIFGHGHGPVDEGKSPVTHFTIETDDHSEDSEDELTTAPQEQVSPLAPSTECFRIVATYDRPVSNRVPTHPPTPAIRTFQIVVNSHSQPETSDLNISSVPSLDSDSATGSPRLAGVVVNNEPLRSQLKPLVDENIVDIGRAEERDGIKVIFRSTLPEGPFPYSSMHSPTTLWPPQSAFSCSSDKESHSEYNEHRSSYDTDGLTNYIEGLCLDNGADEGQNCDVENVSADISSGNKMIYHEKEILGYDNENTDNCASDEDEDGAHAKEEPQSNSKTYSISDCHDHHSSDFPEYYSLLHNESFVASPDHDGEKFNQLGIALPLPPPSVQAPAWEGSQGDLKVLMHEHLVARGQLEPERKELELKPVINNKIHFIPFAGPQTSKSDLGSEGNADMPQWLPSPETPTFGGRLQNRVLGILKADRKKNAICGNRNSVRTQKLLDEGFKSASLYTGRKRVDRAKIGAPLGPVVIESDDINMQQLVAMAEEWRYKTAERAQTSPSKSSEFTGLSSVSLPRVASIKRVETFETDDDVSSIDDAFAVHTPLRPRSILPDRDRHRRSRSLPGAFTFTASGIYTGAARTPDRLRHTEEGTEQTRKEKEVVLRGEIDLKGNDEGRDERQSIGVEGKRKDDSQAIVGQQWLRDTKENDQESKAESLVHPRLTNEASPLSPSVTYIANRDTLHERTGHTLVYEDILFELIQQRTVSGSSILLGSDTVSLAGSSRKNSAPSLWEEPQEVTLVSTTASSICSAPVPSSTFCSETPLPANLDPLTSSIQHTPPRSEYDSPVQARLNIGPATEIFIPVILEDAYCLNVPPPGVMYEETPQPSSSSGILPATETKTPPQLLMPLSRYKQPVLRTTTTLCSPGAGKTNQFHVPLRKRSISKPLVALESIGSVQPVTSDDLAIDPLFMVPTRHPPLPLRRSQSQASIRMTPSLVTSRRPPGGDIISTGSLESRRLVRELQTPSLSSQQDDKNKNNGVIPEGNALRLALTTVSPKAPLHQDPSLGILDDQDLRQCLKKPVSGSRRLAPASLKAALPSSRLVKGIKSIPSPIIIPTHNHSFEQVQAGEDLLRSPVTPLTGKLIYSAPETSPLPITIPRRASPLHRLSQYSPRLQSWTYVYIPYTIPRIGGGVIERKHRLKLATGRAGKRARSCKGCAIQGGGTGKVQMWFCLEEGCGWELCEECVSKKNGTKVKWP